MKFISTTFIALALAVVAVNAAPVDGNHPPVDSTTSLFGASPANSPAPLPHHARDEKPAPPPAGSPVPPPLQRREEKPAPPPTGSPVPPPPHRRDEKPPAPPAGSPVPPPPQR
ncbi:hypothetical protein GYMLUDRAFT_251503, partial [Collybiopsis luxurians FD-317 M1]